MMYELKKHLARTIFRRVRILAAYEPNGVIRMAYTAFLRDSVSNL